MSSKGKDKSPSGYQVGYGKPSAQTRFKKGQSGNPNGRPKGTLNLATVITKTLRERVVINENGQRKIVTKLEAAVKQLVNKAASGDLPAFRQLSGLLQMAEQWSGQAAAPTAVLSEVDQKVMLAIVRRYEQTAKDGAIEPDYE